MTSHTMPSLDDAYACLRTGDIAGARSVLDAMGGSEDDAEWLRASALTARLSGDREQCILLMQRAARSTRSAHSAIELGRMLAEEGRIAEALDALQEAVSRDPQSAAALHAMGVTLYQAGRDLEARDAFRSALARSPGQPHLLRALAEVEYALERPAQAIPLFDALSSSEPTDPELQLRRSQCRRKLGDVAGALAIVDKALAYSPENAQLWLERGWVQEDRGNAAAASAAYARACALRPEWGDPLGAAIALARQDAPDEMLAAGRRLAASAALPQSQRAYLHMTLGKHADSVGDHARAAEHWCEGNALSRLQHGGFDRTAYRAQVDALIGASDRESLAFAHSRALQDRRPVFIVGMPRSGTTLAEQVLAAHPQAHGCGERISIVEIAEAAGALSVTAPPLRVETIDSAWLRTQAMGYLNEGARAAPDAVRLVDKQPYNFLHVGLLAALFADARIVWCRRDRRDIAVSIFGEHFSPLATYATHIEDILCVCAEQERLMQYWQSVSPLPILELRYEDVVSDQEAQIRRLVAFAGLPWDDRCLSFHASGRSVHTLSRWQVRQPIHARSVGRWRHYAQWLPALSGSDSRHF